MGGLLRPLEISDSPQMHWHAFLALFGMLGLVSVDMPSADGQGG
ncbi:hypothetical protein ACFOPX_03280 [Helicobacter baculiformis]|uniref:Uncharacterized protein n=1 Tax=Helicobacter baculiformis TaxID=427351 RepID=A0ABV7ZJJ9_9HELI|nr:hypothetical protein [Helicobacter baculiformis]